MPSGLFIQDLAANLLGEESPWPSDALSDPSAQAEIAREFASDPLVPHVCLTDALSPHRAAAIADDLEGAKFAAHHHRAYKISVARRDAQRESTLTAFMDWLKTDDAAAHHRALVGWPKPLRCVQVQTSRLRAGDYFPPHIDTEEEGISAVYAFTNDWKPQWGGQLFFPNEDGKDRLVVPVMFNALFLFRPRGAAHGVRRIQAQAKKRYRYTVTAFFLEQGQPEPATQR